MGAKPINPMLLADFYKIGHRKQYPPHTEYVYSTWIARKSYMEGVTETVAFGFQRFIRKYLLSYFNDNFFSRPVDEVVAEYDRIIKFTLGGEPDHDHIVALHNLGYLPLRIRAVPEGTLMPLRVPSLTVENTLPEFYWVTNFIESLLSTETWTASTSATIAHEYRKLLDSWARKTNPEAMDFVPFQGHDFSMRGMSSVESGCASGVGHLLSFVGTDTIPAICEAERYYYADVEKELVGTSVPACYDDQTDILTENGFKRFADLDEDERVAQYHENGSIDFVVPTAYVDEEYNGDMVHFQISKAPGTSCDIMVTPNHRMVLRSKSTGELVVGDAADCSFNSNWKLPVAGWTTGGEKLTWLDRLAVAFQADGSYSSRSSAYNGDRTGTFPLRFSLKKERKKERLREILDNLEWEYSWNEYENGYCSVRVKSPVRLSKDFDWIDFASISVDWAEDFLEEITQWDGNKATNLVWSYPNTDLRSVEQVQAVAALTGWRSFVVSYDDRREDYARRRIYTLTLNIQKSEIDVNKATKSLVPYSGRIYCVSVPTKMLVVRRNGNVAICGNTEHSVMCAGGHDDELGTYRRLMTDVYPGGILSIVSDTWDLWNSVQQILGVDLHDVLMERDGKIVVRPDSGDPVDILTGSMLHAQRNYSYAHNTPSQKGVVELLCDAFGGTISSTGYKVLDPHIGVIYGDSITLGRAQAICERLEAKGFASTNVVLGIGSYTYQCQTRDTFGTAMKATDVVIDGVERAIYKDPVTDSGMKKSLTGRVVVSRDSDNNIIVMDNLTMEQQAIYEENGPSLLQDVFVDGRLVRFTTLAEIRERLAQARG